MVIFICILNVCRHGIGFSQTKDTLKHLLCAMELCELLQNLYILEFVAALVML